MSNADVIICRPAKAIAALAFFGSANCLLLAAIPFLPPRRAAATTLDNGMTAGLCIVLLFLPSLLFIIWTLRARVMADTDGLRWRGLGRERRASWPEVTDYYQVLTQVGSKQSRDVVETQRGRLSMRKDFWSDTSEIRAAIEQRATAARAQEWGILGTRPALDWPRTFRYNSPDSRFTAGIVCALLLALVWWIMVMVPHTRQAYSGPGAIWEIAGAVVIMLLLSPFALLGVLAGQQVKDTWRRRTHQITVSIEGIAFTAGDRKVKAAWDEVIDYFWTASSRSALPPFRSIVRTTQGEFDFTRALRDVPLLEQIIAGNATQARTREWKPDVDPEALGGEAARWSSGCVGVGERVFHYWTRTNRAMLWYVTSIFWLPLFVLLVKTAVASTGLVPPPPQKAAFLVLLCLPMLWCWWRYRAARVETDGEGITQQTFSGPRRLRWSEVERYFFSGDETLRFGNVCGVGKRIRFWIGIADVEELKAEITRRAMNSETKTWEGTLKKLTRPREDKMRV